MVCAWTVFEELGQLHVPSRDDLMLVKIAKRLPELFAQPIANPIDPDEMLGSKWTAEERSTAINAAAEMHDEVSMAVHNCYLPEVATKRMRTIFGERIPNRADLVSVKTAAAATIAAAPVVYSPAPEVGRSKSG
jgi:cyclic GMP-AMP synthase